MEPWQLESTIQQTQLILANYRRWFGEDLIAGDRPPLEQAKILFESPFVLLAHDTASDPIYTYGNQTALTLWERTWEELLQMPSRQSAENIDQAQAVRNQLLQDTRNFGYKTGFSGIRVSKSGQRIRIEDVKLWDLLDESGEYRGQAAVFSKWTFLDEITP